MLGKGYTQTKKGFREDIGIYVRSSWEANAARIYNWLQERGEILEWKYESETFWFEGIKRGVCSYKPDFWIRWKEPRVHNVLRGKKLVKIVTDEEFIEIKGYFDARSKTKIARFARYYPDLILSVVDGKTYKALEKQFSRLVANWE